MEICKTTSMLSQFIAMIFHVEKMTECETADQHI